MSNICTDLKKNSEKICNIAQCVNSIEGISSVSASPTDIWLVKFDKKTKYGGKRLKNGFMKIWLDESNVSGSIKHNIQGLLYEIKVYRDIIKPLLDNNRCPNFVKYLGSSEGCSFEQMLNIASSNVKDRNATKRVLIRKAKRMMDKAPKNKPTITGVGKDSVDIMGDIQYNFLLTEAVMKPVRSYYDAFLRNFKYIPWDALFQVFIACKAMSSVGLVHNDLHPDNVLIQAVDEHILTYKVGKKIYSFTTKYKVMVFDFDRSYSTVLGPNTNLMGKCNKGNQCNRFVENKDPLKFSMYIIDAIKRAPSNPVTNMMLIQLLEIFTYGDPGLNQHLFIDVANSMFLKVGNTHMRAEDFSKFNNIDTILELCFNHIETKTQRKAAVTYKVS